MNTLFQKNLPALADISWRSKTAIVLQLISLTPIGPLDSEIAKVLLPAIALCLVVTHVKNAVFRLPVWVLAYVVIGLAGVANSMEPSLTFALVFRTASSFVVVSVALGSMTKNAIRTITASYFVLTFTTCLLIVVVRPDTSLVAMPTQFINWRLTIPHSGIGKYGIALICAGAIWGSAQLVSSGSCRRSGSLAVSGLGFAGMLASQSRLAILSFCLGLATYFGLRSLRSAILMSAVVAILAGLALTPPLRSTWDREAAAPAVDNALSYRQQIFEASVERFQENPLIGGGIGSGDRNLEIELGKDGLRWNAHSELGTILAATGLLGFFAVGAGVTHSLAGSIREFRNSGDRLPLVVLVFVLIAMPFESILGRTTLATVPFLIGVLPTIMRSPRNKANPSS